MEDPAVPAIAAGEHFPDTAARAPRVSVVMAAYNGEPYIGTAIRTVLAQDFADLELIVVDDGSTDGTAQTVSAFGDARVVYHRNSVNLGQTASLNVGLRLARGEYVARLDADDEYLPGKLSAQVAFMDANPAVALCGTWAECIDERGAPSGTFRSPTGDTDVAFRLVWSSPLCHVSVLMRRALIVAAGGYDESYRYAADYRLWSELAARGHRLANIPRPLMKYRVFAGSFGGASVLGDAGWESARIIADNARRFCNVDLTVDEARAIHLRSHPQWGGELDRIAAHRRLTQIALGIYGGARLRVRAELFAALVWSLASAPGTGARARDCRPGELTALMLGRLLRRLKPGLLAPLKSLAMRLVRPGTR